MGSFIIVGIFIILEVCFFFYYILFRGNCIIKVLVLSFEVFDFFNFDFLVKVISLGVDVNWGLVWCLICIKEFNVIKIFDMIYVVLFCIFFGIWF